MALTDRDRVDTSNSEVWCTVPFFGTADRLMVRLGLAVGCRG